MQHHSSRTGSWCTAALLLALLTGASCGARAQPAEKPEALNVAPNAERTTPEASPDNAQAGGPANICQELLAHLQSAEAKAQRPAGGNQATDSAGARATGPSPDRPQQSSGQSAPIPNDEGAAKPAPVSIGDVSALLQANDLVACRDRAREMRRAGVALPPGLIALAALPDHMLSGTSGAVGR